MTLDHRQVPGCGESSLQPLATPQHGLQADLFSVSQPQELPAAPVLVTPLGECILPGVLSKTRPRGTPHDPLPAKPSIS